MSEPATSGKVVFETTHGPLELQLWCRECPATTRLFLQLCIDGFYDNMLFHRIVPSFLIQTGAIRQTSTARAPVGDYVDSAMKEYRKAIQTETALERRKLELHSRLRFNHRGQVSMALPVEDDEDAEDLQPQFFITLEESRNLDGKYVLFGTITGPTFFNAMRIGNMDVDPSTNQPVDLDNAPRIISVKIVDNPLHQDITPQQRIPWRVMQKEAPKKKKRKGKFDRNVLSFGDEIEDADVLLSSSNKKSKNTSDNYNVKSRTEANSTGDRIVDNSLDGDNHEAPFTHTSIEAPTSIPTQSLPNDRNLKATTKTEPKTKSIIEMRNKKYQQMKVGKREREEDTMTKLFAFKSKVRGNVSSAKSEQHEDNSLAARMARRAQGEDKSVDVVGTTYHGQVLESDEEDEQTNADWLRTQFKCRQHIDNTTAGDGRNMEDYEVVDPWRGDKEHVHKKRDHDDSQKEQHRGDRYHKKRHREM